MLKYSRNDLLILIFDFRNLIILQFDHKCDSDAVSNILNILWNFIGINYLDTSVIDSSFLSCIMKLIFETVILRNCMNKTLI